MTGGKRLTPPQSRKVNSLVKKECCNCERGHCILLDDGEECVCPQLISCSLLCKWFQIAVLPLEATVCRAFQDRGQKALYRVRHVLCIKIEQRQILPGLPEADYPQTGSRAHEETACGGYAIRAKKALIYRA